MWQSPIIHSLHFCFILEENNLFSKGQMYFRSEVLWWKILLFLQIKLWLEGTAAQKPQRCRWVHFSCELNKHDNHSLNIGLKNLKTQLTKVQTKELKVVFLKKIKDGQCWLSDASLNGAPLPLLGCDLFLSAAFLSLTAYEQLEEKPVLTQSESVLHELLQQRVHSSNESGSFSLQQLITFVFSVRLSELIYQLVAHWCDALARGFSLWEKRRALLLKQGAQSATCLTCKTAAGAPGRFSLAENLNKSYSVENPKGWREGREMRSARGIERKDHFHCEQPCEPSTCTHTQFCDVICICYLWDYRRKKKKTRWMAASRHNQCS